MMEIFIFALKALILVLSFASIILLLAFLKAKNSHKNELDIEPLHEKQQDMALFLKSVTSTKEEIKEEKKKLKENKKEEKDNKDIKKVFVIDFEGDIHASQVDSLREEITAALHIATAKDEVVVKIHSPGGVVHGYGLAASQLLRVREKNIPLTVCVDEVAASGGYMMSCVANKIISAPFAIIGSIGVVAQVPNFHKVLKKYDVEYKEYTAGEYKRTVSLFGEITPKGEEKFVERLSDTHILFKNFVQKFRPALDLSKVATGEYWFGEEAKILGLVDEIKTSDEYLLSFEPHTHIYKLKYEIKENWQDRIAGILGKVATETAFKLSDHWTKPRT